MAVLSPFTSHLCHTNAQLTTSLLHIVLLSLSITDYQAPSKSLSKGRLSSGGCGYHLACVAQMVKHLPTMQETWVQSLVWEDLLQKEMATHSRTLAWKIPWLEEPGRL